MDDAVLKVFEPKRTIVALAAVAGLVSAPWAFGQQAAASRHAVPSAPLEEVIVTGERLTDTGIGRGTSFGVLGEREILDTPFSVSAFTEALIDNTGARSLSELLVRDPSVSAEITGSGYRDSLSIRGFAVGTGAYLYDGIIGLVPTDGYLPLATVERVEVFRGANAFIVGASAGSGVGGAINIVPKRPAAEAVNEVTIGYHTDSPLVAVDFSRRFGAGDRFGARVSGARQVGDGAADQYRRHTESYALNLEWRASDDLSFGAQVDRFRDRTDGYRDNILLLPGVRVPDVPDPKRNYLQPWTFIEQSGVRALVQARWEFAPGWKLSGGYGEIDGDGENGYFSAFGRVINDAGDIVSAPFRSFQPERDVGAGQALLTGEFDAGGVTSKVTLGYSTATTTFLGSGSATPPITSNIYRPVYVPEPAVAPGGAPSKFDTSVRSLIGIYEAKLFGDRLSLLGGLRDVEIEVDTLAADYDDGKASPFGAVSFKPTANSQLYVSYTQGLERGGVAPIGAINANEALPPGVAEQYELGAKVDLSGLIVSAAIFEISRPLEFLNADRRYVQDGLQVHRGAEFQAQGNVGERLRLVSGITYLDASVDNGNSSVRDNRPLGVPEVSASLFADADVEALPGLSLSAGLLYESAQFADLANTQRVGGWTRVDVGTRYSFSLGETDLVGRLSVDNVLNDGYWAVNAGGALVLSAPRTVRLSLSANF